MNQLEAEWWDLWRRSDRATPFQSPAWLLNWWRFYGGGELQFVALRDATGALSSLAPLYLYRDPLAGVRKLLFVGAGNSDYLDILSDPESTESVIHALGQLICATTWDICELFPIPETSPLMRATLGHMLLTRYDTCPLLTLTPEPRIPAHQRDNVAYYRRRAERLGRVHIEVATGTHQIERWLSTLREWQISKWADAQTEAAFAEHRTLEFHGAVASAFLVHGLLRMYALHIGAALAAVWYGFAYRRRTYYYLGGYCPEFAKCSPGTLLICHAIEQARLEGCHVLDFLRGREAYKYLWGATDAYVWHCALQPSLKDDTDFSKPASNAWGHHPIGPGVPHRG